MSLTNVSSSLPPLPSPTLIEMTYTMRNSTAVTVMYMVLQESQLVSEGGQLMFEDHSEEYQLHEFKVVSRNDAGDSEPKVITETLPISESAQHIYVHVYNAMCTPYTLPGDVICYFPYHLFLVHYRSQYSCCQLLPHCSPSAH